MIQNGDIISSDIKERFPDLKVSLLTVKGLKIEKGSPQLEKFKEDIIKEIKSPYDLETLKDNETFRKYRDFFWKIDIDPTKIRHACPAFAFTNENPLSFFV